jgi:hypothetical protein
MHGTLAMATLLNRNVARMMILIFWRARLSHDCRSHKSPYNCPCVDVEMSTSDST